MSGEAHHSSFPQPLPFPERKGGGDSYGVWVESQWSARCCIGDGPGSTWGNVSLVIPTCCPAVQALPRGADREPLALSLTGEGRLGGEGPLRGQLLLRAGPTCPKSGPVNNSNDIYSSDLSRKLCRVPSPGTPP